MLSREEIIATYEQGPNAVVALVESLVAALQQQIEQCSKIRRKLNVAGADELLV